MKDVVFWDMIPWGSSKKNRLFGGCLKMGVMCSSETYVLNRDTASYTRKHLSLQRQYCIDCRNCITTECTVNLARVLSCFMALCRNYGRTVEIRRSGESGDARLPGHMASHGSPPC
jgi:hypothetical protein